MKIAVSSDGASIEADVAQQFGIAHYMLIIDIESGDLEVISRPGKLNEPGSGVKNVVLAVSKNVDALITGYCSPAAKRQLEENGIKVFSSFSGTVKDAIENYKKGTVGDLIVSTGGGGSGLHSRKKTELMSAFKRSVNQFAVMLPMFIGVVLLMGLFNAFVSKDKLASIFSGNIALDTLWGACFGSILAGNPINSYIIGGELLQHGVSLFAVTAFILSWVTIGVVQLPAEIVALGRRFALVRTAVAFIMSMLIAVVTVLVVQLIGV